MKYETIHRPLQRTVHAAVALAFAVGSVLLIGGCGKGDDAEAKGNTGGKRPPPLIRVGPVVEKSLAPRVVVVGTVTAKRKSIVASGANGVVDTYSVDEGEWVKQGTILSQLRMKSSNRELAQAKAIEKQRKAEYDEAQKFRTELINQAKFHMNAAKTSWETAKRKLALARRAYKNNAIDSDRMEDAVEQEKRTSALYLAAKADHERLVAGPRTEKRIQAQQAWEAQKEQVGFLEAEQEKRTTRAPFSGYVVSEHSFDGQWLSKGDPVATIAMLDEVDVVVNVDQSDIQHVQLGELADVSIQGVELVSVVTSDNRNVTGLPLTESAAKLILVDESGEKQAVLKSEIASRKTVPWTGRIVQIVPKSDWQTGSRGFPVKVRIKNRFRSIVIQPEDGGEPRKRIQPILKEGMMATVTFQGAEVATYLVPKDALVRSTQGINVHVYRPSKENFKQGRTMRLRVQTGIGLGNLIQVIPDPANPGEPKKLTPGMYVVTEGGERLAPVQGEVIVADDVLSPR